MITNTITNASANNCCSWFPAQNRHLAVWPRPKHLVLVFLFASISSYATFLFERKLPVRCIGWPCAPSDWAPPIASHEQLCYHSFQEMARKWQAKVQAETIEASVQEEIASHEQLCYLSRNVIGWKIVSVREVCRRTRSWWQQTVRFFHRRQRLASIKPQRL